MYVTRPLSVLQKSAENLAAAPEGPNSGILVIQDEESETYSLFGLRKDRTVKKLPFPQDKELTVRYPRSWGLSANVSGLPIDVIGDVALDAALPSDSSNSVLFVPALNQPLSSNRYYAVVPHGKHKGEALTSSKEEDAVACCCSSGIDDVKPRPLDPGDAYQQFEIIPGREADGFSAKSAAADGIPPKFLRKKSWTVTTKTPDGFKLAPAQGLDSDLRARPPELDSAGARVVGKWYSPFMFVKEGTLREQVERSMYYEVTLEQRWERIFSRRKSSEMGNTVAVEAVIEKEQVFVGGRKVTWKERSAVDGVIWFETEGGGGGVGLRVEIVERMKWEAEKGGWRREKEEEREVKINKVEEFEGEGSGDWNEFGCYVLVERFNFRRMDGSLVISYDFKHFHLLKTKWEN